MIIPMVCFTCGKPCAHLYERYQELVKKYELEAASGGKDKTPEFLALADLKIGRSCCRRMYICQHDMYEKVK
jgi:DNA-directed RNA polymerase subunit N (RpoN/RPB10)